MSSVSSFATTALLFAAVFGLGANPVVGADPAPAAPPAVAAAGDEPVFRYVYIPTEELDVLFQQERGVLLSRADFLAVWKKAYPNGKTPDPIEKSDDLFVAQADYAGKTTVSPPPPGVDAPVETLQLTGKLTIVKRNDEWQGLLLDLAGVSIASATIGDEPALIGRDPKGNLRVFLEKAGEHVLTLDLRAKLESGALARTARFRLPSAPGVLQLATAADEELQIDGSVAPVDAQPAADPKAPRRTNVPLGGRGDLAVLLRRVNDAAEQPPVLVARVDGMVYLTPAQADYRLTVKLQAYSKPVEVVRLKLPVGLQLALLESPGVVRSTPTAGDDGTTLTVVYAAPWTGEREITMNVLGAPTLNAPWKLPRMRVLDAAAQTERLTVRPDPSLTVELKNLRGARRLSPPAGDAASLYMECWDAAAEATLAVRPAPKALASSIVSVLSVGRNRLELQSSVAVEPRGAPIFDVGLLVPAGWTVVGLTAGDAPLPFDAVEKDGKLVVRATLPAPVPVGGTLTLTLKAERSPDDWLNAEGKTSTLPLANVSLEAAAEVEGMLLVRAGDDLEVQTVDLKGFEQTPPSTVPQADAEVRV
ncbi:MAG: hypothetical protein ACRC1K_22945, partial [Planctomycetia bacterium]